MKVISLTLDHFLALFAAREGMITGEPCGCPVCTAERHAEAANASLETSEVEANELVNAFIRGFNFKATEGAATEAPKPQRLAMLPMARPRDIYSAISQANGHPAVTQEKWEAEPQSVHNFYEHVARFMNEALAAR